MDRRAAAADLDRDRGPAARPLARLVQHQHRADPDEQLPQRRRIGPRPGLLSESFPAGASAPAYAIVPDPEKAPAVAQALASQDSVEDVRLGDTGPPGQQIDVILADDPYATSTYDEIPKLRAVAKEAGGNDVLIGGPTAIERDLRVAAAHDSKLIPPVALAVVLLILIVLLRSLVAPLILIGTVILSFAAALGVGYVVFDVIFDFAGSDPSLPSSRSYSSSRSESTTTSS